MEFVPLSEEVFYNSYGLYYMSYIVQEYNTMTFPNPQMMLLARKQSKPFIRHF